LFLSIRVRADSRLRPQGKGEFTGGGGEGWNATRVRADAVQRPRGRECFTPGNFITDVTMHPSHGRPRGHRPTQRPSSDRPSVRNRPRDNPTLNSKGQRTKKIREMKNTDENGTLTVQWPTRTIARPKLPQIRSV
jgi:hypothetical protein